MSKLKHIVLLDRERVQQAARKLDSKGFTLLAFLSAQCRNSDPVCRWGEQSLRRFLGWDTRTVKANLGRLAMYRYIKREIQPGGLQVVDVGLVSDNSDSIKWRCGPIQNEKLRDIGPAVRTLMLLASYTEPKLLKIQNGQQPIAEFVAERTELSVATAKRHIATLKNARLLNSYSGRSGRKRNQHDWFLSAKMMLKVSPNT